MKIYILRHGETDWNVRKVFQGQTDTELNADGIAQAKTCRKRVQELGLHFDTVYSSPLRRALRTVEIVTGLPREQIHLDERLKEMNFGPLDGTPFEPTNTVCGHLFDDPPHYLPPEGAESYEDVIRRQASFYRELALSCSGENILVGSHGCAMRLALVWMHYIPLSRIWHQGIGNCTIIEAELDPSRLQEDCPYHVTHLYETADWFH